MTCGPGFRHVSELLTGFHVLGENTEVGSTCPLALGPSSNVSPSFTGNMDRHHYEMFTKFGDDGFLIHLDNARG